MSNEFAIVTREVIPRVWNEIEPKVAAGFATGTFAAIVINVLLSYGVHITPELKQYLPAIFVVLGGYIFPSNGLLITSKNVNGDVTTKTTGHTVTTFTGGIPIQAPAAPAVPATPLRASADAFLAARAGSGGTAETPHATGPALLPDPVEPNTAPPASGPDAATVQLPPVTPYDRPSW